VAVEHSVGEEPEHVGPHLGHEVLAELAPTVPESARMPFGLREEHQADVLEGVTAQDHRARLLHPNLAGRVDILDPAGVASIIGQDAYDATVGLEVEVASRERFGNRG
jgi:hypothetical protein